jgi:hypothetical protein
MGYLGGSSMNFKIKDEDGDKKSEWMLFKIAVWCNTFNWHDDKLIRESENKVTYQCQRCDRYRDILKSM